MNGEVNTTKGTQEQISALKAEAIALGLPKQLETIANVLGHGTLRGTFQSFKDEVGNSWSGRFDFDPNWNDREEQIYNAKFLSSSAVKPSNLKIIVRGRYFRMREMRSSIPLHRDITVKVDKKIVFDATVDLDTDSHGAFDRISIHSFDKSVAAGKWISAVLSTALRAQEVSDKKLAETQDEQLEREKKAFDIK